MAWRSGESVVKRVRVDDRSPISVPIRIPEGNQDRHIADLRQPDFEALVVGHFLDGLPRRAVPGDRHITRAATMMRPE